VDCEENGMEIKAVLFDLFDTLILIEHGDAFYVPSLARLHEFLVKKGINVSFEDFRRAYSAARDALYAEAAENLEEPHFNLRVAKTLQNLGYNFDSSSEIVTGATMAFYEEFMKYLRIDENAKEALRKLHGKYKLGIVSNFAIPECVCKLLEMHGLDVFFDVVVVSGAVNRRKPSPEIFRKALERLGVDASETVFVGDTVDADIGGAKKVGMKTVFIERRQQKEAEHTCPDQTIKSLNELQAALERC